VSVYDINGHYYRAAVRGARPALVYMYNSESFLPPTDQEWLNFDKRFPYKHQPGDDDRRGLHFIPARSRSCAARPSGAVR
jgi:hypothetical protein